MMRRTMMTMMMRRRRIMMMRRTMMIMRRRRRGEMSMMTMKILRLMTITTKVQVSWVLGCLKLF